MLEQCSISIYIFPLPLILEFWRQPRDPLRSAGSPIHDNSEYKLTRPCRLYVKLDRGHYLLEIVKHHGARARSPVGANIY